MLLLFIIKISHSTFLYRKEVATRIKLLEFLYVFVQYYTLFNRVDKVFHFKAYVEYKCSLLKLT